ncbi:erythromycin esterase family protein [Micropruina sp.]|uniref:erythromycin esterase family protein n=1 Tax=Micropruina sp. TaxID=2737536 RepID=UPI002627049B|nr:erythromycin esterase family protein [Micropruina sp.]
MRATPPPVRRRRGRSLIIVVLALALVAVAGGAVHWWQTRPQGNPQAVEFATAPLSPELTGATVLALGEATHGNAEFQRLRLSLVQKLPEFRALVLEEDYGSTARVNEFIQGGPGTAEEAVQRFGFVLNHTAEMAELLRWLRDHNADVSAEQRIQLVGIDVQRIDANKEIALSWLTRHDPDVAKRLRAQLTDWTDATRGAADAAERDRQARPVVEQLATAISSTPNKPGRLLASNAARTLTQYLNLNEAGMDYGKRRAELMADNLNRTVAEQHERGNDHSLLFAHNGHVDKASAASGYRDLGGLVADRLGDGYRVIGTEFVSSRFRTGEGRQRWEVTMNNPTPLRGMFTGTTQGYLEFAMASAENRELLGRPVRMASAGEAFQQWQAWIPWFNSVEMVPSASYDALILVQRATPVTPL